MELLKAINEIRIANCIKDAIEGNSITSSKSDKLTIVKKVLKEQCNLIFFSIISSSNSDLKIMAKTKEHSYTYNYSFRTREISLIGGIRKNVVTN